MVLRAGVPWAFRGLGVWGGSDLALPTFGGLKCRLEVEVVSSGGLGATPLGGGGDPLALSKLVGAVASGWENGGRIAEDTFLKGWAHNGRGCAL